MPDVFSDINEADDGILFYPERETRTSERDLQIRSIKMQWNAQKNLFQCNFEEAPSWVELQEIVLLKKYERWMDYARIKGLDPEQRLRDYIKNEQRSFIGGKIYSAGGSGE